MLAFVGWVGVDFLGLRFPGATFSSITDSLSAHNAAVANGSMAYVAAQSLNMISSRLKPS